MSAARWAEAVRVGVGVEDEREDNNVSIRSEYNQLHRFWTYFRRCYLKLIQAHIRTGSF